MRCFVCVFTSFLSVFVIVLYTVSVSLIPVGGTCTEILRCICFFPCISFAVLFALYGCLLSFHHICGLRILGAAEFCFLHWGRAGVLCFWGGCITVWGLCIITLVCIQNLRVV
ncbi:hypothetical protein BDD12DRAFT_828947 [Trichophaea hybrida]|nr:hypothetical protein BDD12DRAFT_828947 [Trichophaea hybrida]